MRIFIGMLEVAGYYAGLARGFEQLGIDCHHFSYSHGFRYDREWTQERKVERALKYLSVKRTRTPRRQLIAKLLTIGAQKMLLSALFLDAIAGYDVFIFNGGQSFFNNYELHLLKLLNKKIIYVFNGSDHRPPYLNGVFVTKIDDETADLCIKLARHRKRRLKRIESYADYLVGHIHSAHFHERPLIPFSLIGAPAVVSGNADVPDQRQPKRSSTYILHCPSNINVKGTLAIRKIVDHLKNKGHGIEYREIIGKPHSEVIREIRKCDIVFDQIYSDTRMAGLAVEASYFGKPVVVGGYVDERYYDLQRLYPQGQFPPTYYYHPKRVEQALETLINSKELQREIGLAQQQFVKEVWSPIEVAKRFTRLIIDDVPPEWYFEPCKIHHLHGGGVSEELARRSVAAVIRRGGIEALQLSDKPQLERKFTAFAAGH